MAQPDLARRLTAEAIGSAFLVATVVGSGIFAQRLSPRDPGLQLLENSLATAGGLVALVLAFGPISGGHLNPAVSLVDRLLGGLTTLEALAYAAAQLVGACVGAVVANLMFSLPAVTLSTHQRSGVGLALGEVVATFGLITVILGVVRSGRGDAAPFAVGAYIAAAYWFTSSTSFANPAVTLGRSLTDTFAGIALGSVPLFIAMQLVGAALACLLARYLYPTLGGRADRRGRGPSGPLPGGEQERTSTVFWPVDRRRQPPIDDRAVQLGDTRGRDDVIVRHHSTTADEPG